MELPPDDDAGPSISAVPNILSMTHQVLPEEAFKTPTPARKRIGDLKTELLSICINLYCFFQLSFAWS